MKKKKPKTKIHRISNVCTVLAIGEQIESAFSYQKKKFHYNVTTQSVFSQYFYSTRERQEGPFHLGGFFEPWSWSHSKCYFPEAELQSLSVSIDC